MRHTSPSSSGKNWSRAISKQATFAQRLCTFMRQAKQDDLDAVMAKKHCCENVFMCMSLCLSQLVMLAACSCSEPWCKAATCAGPTPPVHQPNITRVPVYKNIAHATSWLERCRFMCWIQLHEATIAVLNQTDWYDA